MWEVRDSVAAISRRRGSDTPAHPAKLGEDDDNDDKEEEDDEEEEDDDDDDEDDDDDKKLEEEEAAGITLPNFLVHALRALTTCIIAPMPSTYACCAAETLA